MQQLAEKPAANAARPTLLVVEDEILIRMHISEELRGRNYRVFEAANADEALQILNSSSIDLVVTDIKMPGSIDGLELARRVRTTWPFIKIVILSANLPVAWELCADACFEKPYSPVALLDAIDALLADEPEEA